MCNLFNKMLWSKVSNVVVQGVKCCGPRCQMLWSKVSNAIDRSKNILIGVSFESSAVIVLLITSMTAYSVE